MMFLGTTAFASAPCAPDLAEIVEKMTKTEDQRRAELGEYSATRKYIMKNHRWKEEAQMVVRLTYRDGQGKTFQVLSLTGVDGIQKRVFNKLLEAETEASRSKSQDLGLITAQNYDFLLLPDEVREGRRCYVLQLIPKGKEKYLLNGKVWVDAAEYAIVHLEGRTAANVSFWVGKPYIVQDFSKVGDYWLASHNRSVSDVKLFGQTELTIEYSGYQLPTAEARIRHAARARRSAAAN